MAVRILDGDALGVLRGLPDGHFQTCVTSPPYYGLRDYGVAGQIGLEPSPEEYIAKMVAVFREVRRVLRDDGTLWLNMGDGYANDGKWGGETGGKQAYLDDASRKRNGREKRVTGLKPKDLIGMPWMLAFALRADGWFLRADIIWSKPNPMPESVRDRPTKAHEYVFLLSKRARYFYDPEAISEPAERGDAGSRFDEGKTVGHLLGRQHLGDRKDDGRRNARSVWTVATQPYSGAHFATMPPDLAERCIKAGTAPGDRVLDPFGGAGTTGLVADRLRRDATLIELNPEYAAMARRRIAQEAPLLAEVT